MKYHYYITPYSSLSEFSEIITIVGTYSEVKTNYFQKLSMNLSAVLKRKTATFTRDLQLFVETPLDYLYTFTIRPKDRIHVESFDPELKKIGESQVKEIQEILPSTTVKLVGSVSFEISGDRDIDIVIESKNSTFPESERILNKLYGKPFRKRRDHIEWRSYQPTYRIEIMLIDPKSRVYKVSMRSYFLFSQRKELLAEYESIKIGSDGESRREYDKRRMLFFHKISRLYQ